MKHTPEPWHIGLTGEMFSNVKGSNDTLVATTSVGRCPGNAARIIECVNACEGIPDPAKAIAEAKKVLEFFQDCHDTGLARDVHFALLLLGAIKKV